jgi:uncharacterized protein
METEIRVLGEADRPAAERFLKQQPSGIALRGYMMKDSMTPKYGLYAGVVEGGEVVSMAAYLGGTFHLVAPSQLEALLTQLGQHRRGPLHQINGPTVQVVQAVQWLNAGASRTLVNSRDELFVLRLSDLKVPPQLSSPSLRCRLGNASDIAFQGAWRHDFWVDNLGAPPGPRLLENCTKLVEQEVAEQTLYVLEDGGRPVCTSAFGPALPDAVQVVNVFTPPAERGRGYARALTAATLLEARARGVEWGVLYTGLHNLPAQRTYRALGFTPVDQVTMLVFAEPHESTPGPGA